MNPLHQALLEHCLVLVWKLSYYKCTLINITIIYRYITFAQHLVKFVIPVASSSDFIVEDHMKECGEVNLAFTFRLQSVGKSSKPIMSP